MRRGHCLGFAAVLLAVFGTHGAASAAPPSGDSARYHGGFSLTAATIVNGSRTVTHDYTVGEFLYWEVPLKSGRSLRAEASIDFGDAYPSSITDSLISTSSRRCSKRFPAALTTRRTSCRMVCKARLLWRARPPLRAGTAAAHPAPTTSVWQCPSPAIGPSGWSSGSPWSSPSEMATRSYPLPRQPPPRKVKQRHRPRRRLPSRGRPVTTRR